MAPPGPDPSGNSAPVLEDEIPMGINRSPTCRMMILRLALRVMVAWALASLRDQSGRTMSVVSTSGSVWAKLFRLDLAGLPLPLPLPLATA